MMNMDIYVYFSYEFQLKYNTILSLMKQVSVHLVINYKVEFCMSNLSNVISSTNFFFLDVDINLSPHQFNHFKFLYFTVDLAKLSLPKFSVKKYSWVLDRGLIFPHNSSLYIFIIPCDILKFCERVQGKPSISTFK